MCNFGPVTLYLSIKTLMLNLVQHFQTKLQSICQNFLNKMMDCLLKSDMCFHKFVTILCYFNIKITKQARRHPEFQTCPIKSYLSG